MTVTLVLLPGMDGSGDLFANFAAAWRQLAPELPLIIVRYPPDHAMGYEELATYVQAQLPAGVPCVVLGESFSGPVAVMLAALAPPNLRGLVLCCTFLRNPAGALRLLRPLLGLLPAQPPRPLLRHYLTGEATGTPIEAALRAALATLSPGVLTARMAAVLEVDVRAEFSRLTLPVLYLRATRDRLIAPRVAESLRRLRPAMHIADFDAPHLLLQTRAPEAADVVRSFVAGLATEGILA